MNKRQTFFLALMGLLAAVVVLTTGAPAALAQSDSTPTPYSEAGEPEPINARICNGEDALVFQSPDETGAGVTMSIYDSWGCLEVAEMLVIGPWGGPMAANAHSACLAHSRLDLVQLAQATGWENGSVWRLMPDNIAMQHPLVVECVAVNVLDEMGLNPHDSHLVPSDYLWVFKRANELLTTEERLDYCVSHGGEGLSENILCASWYGEFQTKVHLFSEP